MSLDDSHKRKRKEEVEEEELLIVSIRKRTKYDNPFIIFLTNAHMFYLLRSFIGNDPIAAARLRTAIPRLSMNPYISIPVFQPRSVYMTIKYYYGTSSAHVFIRNTAPTRLYPNLAGFSDFVMINHCYTRPDAMPLNKDEYEEFFPDTSKMPSYYKRGAANLVFDFKCHSVMVCPHAHSSKQVAFVNRKVSNRRQIYSIFIDGPCLRDVWYGSILNYKPPINYQLQKDTAVLVSHRTNSYAGIYSNSLSLSGIWLHCLKRGGNISRCILPMIEFTSRSFPEDPLTNWSDATKKCGLSTTISTSSSSSSSSMQY